jgi:hypothetical protein
MKKRWRSMKYLNKDDKEFLAIIAGILFIAFGFGIAIFTTVRAHESTPKKYVEECKYNYIKYPLKECWYKEVE